MLRERESEAVNSGRMSINRNDRAAAAGAGVSSATSVSSSVGAASDSESEEKGGRADSKAQPKHVFIPEVDIDVYRYWRLKYRDESARSRWCCPALNWQDLTCGLFGCFEECEVKRTCSDAVKPATLFTICQAEPSRSG